MSAAIIVMPPVPVRRNLLLANAGLPVIFIMPTTVRPPCAAAVTVIMRAIAAHLPVAIPRSAAAARSICLPTPVPPAPVLLQN